MSVLQRYAFQCKQSKSSHTFAKIDVSHGCCRKNAGVGESPVSVLMALRFALPATKNHGYDFAAKKHSLWVPQLKSFYYLCKTWPIATH